LIHHQFVAQLYLNNKNLDAAGLWQKLCVEYCRLSQHRWYGIRPYPLADFASQFCVEVEIAEISEQQKKVNVMALMDKINQRLLSIKLSEAESFLKLLRLFLGCYPFYISKFDKSIIEALGVVAYRLPINVEQVEAIKNISAKLAMATSNRWKITECDLFQAMSEKILDPDLYSDVFLTNQVFCTLPYLTNILPSDQHIKQKLKLINLHQVDFFNSNSIFAIEYIGTWGHKFSDHAKEHLLSTLLDYNKNLSYIGRATTLSIRTTLLGKYSHIFSEVQKRKIILFLLSQLQSFSHQQISSILSCSITYIDTIKEMNLEDKFVSFGILVLNFHDEKMDAMEQLSKFYNIVTDDLKKIILRALISLLSHEEEPTRNNAAYYLHELSSHITAQDTDSIMDYLISRVKQICENFYIYPMGSGQNGNECNRFDLAEKIKDLVSDEKKQEFCDAMLVELNKAYEDYQDPQQEKEAAIKTGGLLYSLFKLYFLIPDARKNEIDEALFFRLQNPYQMQYIYFISLMLEDFHLLSSAERIDKGMQKLLAFACQLPDRRNGLDDFRIDVFKTMNKWFPFASSEMQDIVTRHFHSVFRRMDMGIQPTILKKCNKLALLYFHSQEFEDFKVRIDRGEGSERELRLMNFFNEFNKQINDVYHEKIQQLSVNDEHSKEILISLLQDLEKLSEDNKQTLINTLLIKLPETEFIENIFHTHYNSHFIPERSLRSEDHQSLPQPHLSDLKPSMSQENITKLCNILLSHLASNNPKVFQYTCYLIFKFLPEYSEENKESIYNILSNKLNDNHADIRNSACILTSHLLDVIPREQHSKFVAALLKNIELPENADDPTHIKERVKCLMYSMLANVAVLASASLKEVILNELFLRLVRKPDRHIARCSILHIIPSLSEDRLNYFIYGFIAEKLTHLHEAPELDTYFFDLYAILVDATEDRFVAFEIKQKLNAHLLPDLGNMVAQYSGIKYS